MNDCRNCPFPWDSHFIGHRYRQFPCPQPIRDDPQLINPGTPLRFTWDDSGTVYEDAR